MRPVVMILLMSDDSITITAEMIPTRTVGAVEAEVDGERILLSPKDFSYFGLTGTGAPVWDLIDGERSVGTIIAGLQDEYDAEATLIEAESMEFIDALAAAGLIAFE